MAQHDYVIANGSGSAVRSDLNNALAAIVSLNSGTSEPTDTFAYMLWADTTAGVLKIRNAANNAWITLRELDGTLTIEGGSASTPGLYFSGDTNTGIYSPGADQFAIATNGVERVEYGASEAVFNDGGTDYDFRVEGDTNANLLFADASTDRVGIGTNSPATRVDVDGDVTIRSQGDLRFGDSDNSNWVALQAPATVASNVTWTLPAADGASGESLITNGSGQLAWQATTGMRNRIINGNFDFWQRGTSFTGNEYGADRWIHSRAGTTHTATREPFTLGQTDVPGEPTYFCRTVVSSVAGAGNYALLAQRIEDVRTFAGQQVTVSFWAKVDATKNIAVEFVQDFGTGGSPSADVVAIGTTKVSIGTSWQKVTVTATVPSISGKTLGATVDNYLALAIWFDAGSDWNARTDSLGQQSGTFDIAQVQIEPGPVATPFERRSYGQELALCQRYYCETRASARGYATGISYCETQIYWPVTMRDAPNVVGPTDGFAGNLSGNTVDSVRPTGARFNIVSATSGDSYSVDQLIKASAEL